MNLGVAVFDEAILTRQPSSRALQQHLFRLLNGCNSNQKLAQVHSQIVTNGFSQKNYLVVKTLSLYVSSGHLQNANQVFKLVEYPSVTAWNQIIRGHALSETPRESVGVYDTMNATSVAADEYTYSAVIIACVRGRLLTEGKQVHAKVLSKGYSWNVFVQTNLMNLYNLFGEEEEDGVRDAGRLFGEITDKTVVTWNSFLAGYVRRGDIDGARTMFEEMPERNVVSWTTLIAAYAQNGRCKQALSLFHQMWRAQMELDRVALVAALSACAELGDLKVGKWIHAYTDKNLSGGNQIGLVSLKNALIHMYASCGAIEEACKVFERMQQRSTVSWTSMITAFAKHGYAKEALDVFQRMQNLGGDEVRPDETTFLGVLCACSHGGFVDQGRYLFRCMKPKWGIEPNIEHYGCMVDLLSRAGFFKEAILVVETMPMKPNDAIWGALLSGCMIHKNIELAPIVAQKLALELDPDNATGYLMLSNFYATANMWRDAAAVREKMVEMGLTKPPGRSWIQICGYIHEFFSSDWTHKHRSSVYVMLDDITRTAKWEGYNPDISEVLLDNKWMDK